MVSAETAEAAATYESRPQEAQVYLASWAQIWHERGIKVMRRLRSGAVTF